MSGERRAVTYDGSASQFSVQREPTVRYLIPAVPVEASVEARVCRCGLYAEGFLHHQLHGVASALQDLSTTPVDGVVLCPSMKAAG